ncbi:MAG: bifunctional riboflavin kinase/FAD synthetase [Clostridiaceae bacterium]|nr:bifunctional riboflavin kinase/FAD synthetase [Clostridiaceae bacterium]
MELFFSKDKPYIDISQGMGIALGNFDGLHVGHIELINRLIRICKQKNLKSMVYTFDKHPQNKMTGSMKVPIITPNKLKAQILARYDIDFLLFEEFTEHIMHMSAEDFVKNILVDRFNVKAVVVGFHYRFGYQAKGDVGLLRELGKRYDFYVEVVEPVEYEGNLVSSTMIRELIQAGDVERASVLLNRYYSIMGKVVRGKKIGNKIGFPTINIFPDTCQVLPSKGVYITNTVIQGDVFNSISNIGENPTVNDDKGIRIETHIFDFNEILYDRDVTIQFIKKVREEKKFERLEDLADQISKDVQYAKDYFEHQKILT